MKYAALLRGINVGTTKRIEMKKLKAVFEKTGYSNVSTYINSGNVIFESVKPSKTLRTEIESILQKELGFLIPTVVRSIKELRRIADAIPANWANDETQRTDVAYLFDEIDSSGTLAALPVKKDFVDARYTKGAIFWNVQRVNYNKSRLNKLIGHELYRHMTVRNVNTARYLAGL
jgi:uncharacterized protein (DUF1697 family)